MSPKAPRPAGWEPSRAGLDDFAGRRESGLSLIQNSHATQASNRPHMVLREWRAMRKNTLRGFATVELPCGLIVRDVTVHEKNGRWWASLPARPQLDAEGRAVTNEAGHDNTQPCSAGAGRDLADRFSAAVVGLVRTEHPGDLDGDAP
jgi:hypothetical protein